MYSQPTFLSLATSLEIVGKNMGGVTLNSIQLFVISAAAPLPSLFFLLDWQYITFISHLELFHQIPGP